MGFWHESKSNKILVADAKVCDQLAIFTVMSLSFASCFIVRAEFLEAARIYAGPQFLHAQGQSLTGVVLLLIVAMRLIRFLVLRDLDLLSYKTDLIHCLRAK